MVSRGLNKVPSGGPGQVTFKPHLSDGQGAKYVIL